MFGSTVLSVLFLPWESYGALFPPKPFTAIGKSTSVHVLLVYHVCVNHLTIIVQAKKQLRDHVVSLTKKIEDKQRESERGRNTTRKPLTSPAMAASATYGMTSPRAFRFSTLLRCILVDAGCARCCQK